MSNRLMRDQAPEEGTVFFAMPFGIKPLDDGTPFDYDQFYRDVFAPAVEEIGLVPLRADSLYGPQGVIDVVWRGTQKGEVVVVDFTGRSPNVALEFGWAHLLGKRIVVLTQDPNDIPTDVRGHYRYITYSSHYLDAMRMTEELKSQLIAVRKEPATEMVLVPMMGLGGGTEPAPARVVAVDREFVTIQTDDGRRGVLSNTDVEYTRVIHDMTRRFTLGDRLEGAFEVDLKGVAKYTLLAGQTDPWPLLGTDCAVGTRLTGTVASVVDGVGTFVRVGHGVNGLVPKQSTVGQAPLQRGDEVEVSVTRVDPENRRISLRFERAVTTTVLPGREAGAPELGTVSWGEVVKVVPERNHAGGFLLVKLENREKPAILHCTQMSPELREDLNKGAVEDGEEIYVEVIKVDHDRGKVCLKDLPDPADAEASLAA